jgi:hypothetical protein
MLRTCRLLCVGILLVAGCSTGSKSSLVTGYLAPCSGIGPYTATDAAGTVTALRGVEQLRTVGDRIDVTLPTAVAARVHVMLNKPFRFHLAAGDYVLVGTYDKGRQTGGVPVKVLPATAVHRDIPDPCK